MTGAAVLQAVAVGDGEHDLIGGTAEVVAEVGMVNDPLVTPETAGKPGWVWDSCRNSTVQVCASQSAPSSMSVALPLNEMVSPARKVEPAVGVVIVAWGPFPAAIAIGAEMVWLVPSDTVSRAV